MGIRIDRIAAGNDVDEIARGVAHAQYPGVREQTRAVDVDGDLRQRVALTRDSKCAPRNSMNCSLLITLSKKQE